MAVTRADIIWSVIMRNFKKTNVQLTSLNSEVTANRNLETILPFIFFIIFSTKSCRWIAFQL